MLFKKVITRWIKLISERSVHFKILFIYEFSANLKQVLSIILNIKWNLFSLNGKLKKKVHEGWKNSFKQNIVKAFLAVHVKCLVFECFFVKEKSSFCCKQLLFSKDLYFF